MKPVVLIAGTGFMASAYAQVVQALCISSVAVGRSVERTREFTEATGIAASPGGIDTWLRGQSSIPEKAIVCVSLESTAPTVRLLLDAGVKSILIEKPGGVCADEVAELATLSQARRASVFVGYNRRFFESARQARSLIEAQGGPRSVHFEFTEREKDARSAKFGDLVQRHWGLANSSHVIDLAFHLAGRPLRLNHEVAGTLPWHPGGSRFSGSGVTDKDVLFSYCANWESGGRWSVEVFTDAGRTILRPLEKVLTQTRGSFELSELTFDSSLDTRFKPGIYRQTRAFLEGEDQAQLVTIAEQAAFARLCSTMCGESWAA